MGDDGIIQVVTEEERGDHEEGIVDDDDGIILA